MAPTTNIPTFALLGAAGFVAPRHLSAMRQVGGQLLVACDPHDSVGILDRHFPRASFLQDEGAFRRVITARPVDYVAICSPNDKHAGHCELALFAGSRAICEKPLVLSPSELDRLTEVEQRSGLAIHPILQLRHHPDLCALKQCLMSTTGRHEVVLRYVTTRGPWYHASWKGQEARSGGLVFAIGIHFLDLLLWLFGDVEGYDVHLRAPQRVAGELELERAQVRWVVSVDEADLPAEVRMRGQSTWREITVDGVPLEFSSTFDDLHHEVYRRILAGQGLRLQDAAPALALASALRQAEVSARLPSWLGRVAS